MKYEVKFDSKNINFINITNDLINDYLLMVNDPNVYKFLTLKERNFSYEDEINWIKGKINNNNIVLSMIEKNSNKFIGNIEVMSVTNNIAEIGVSITPKMQNKHYGYEGINRFIDYCLNDLKFNNVTLGVFSFNERAIHLYKKLGFKEYKIDKNIGMMDGQEVDEICMKLK